jgi:ferredoxin
MKINKIRLISFSPTRTSKKVIDAIASGMHDIPAETIDLTYPDAVSSIRVAADELAIIGVPVYAGRVAPLAAKRLAAIQGNNTPAVIVVTYGNRDFEDALVELKDIAESAAFIPMAAATFIGEHSYSGPDTPVGAGRPDSVDLAAAQAFGVKIGEKIAAVKDLVTGLEVTVPGNRPYKDGVGSMPFTPKVIEAKCTQCGVCLAACPTGAISMESEILLDQELCIFCCACIKNCPEDAMIIDAEPIKQKRQWLYENCTERKEPALFL